MRIAELALAFIILPILARAEVNEAAIADVKSGKIKEARASWWGFDAKDSTKALQAAINSSATRVIVEKMNSPWVVTPIHVASDLEIVFEKGVIVEAKKGAFKGGNDSLFNLIRKKDITLTGYGATLRMRRDDYAQAPYSKAEWRNVINIYSSTSVKIYGLTLAESGGDGIYLGSTDPEAPNKDIHIKDVICDKNYRQGISVISAHGLLIEDTVMKNTAGTAPAAGIDFEPNFAGHQLVDCVMKNCLSENNQGAGYLFALVYLSSKSKDISIRMENCVARGTNSSPFKFYLSRDVAEGPVKGLVELTHCTLADSSGPGMTIIQKPASGCRLRFVDCKIVNPAKNNLKAPMILFKTERGQAETMGAIDFVNCSVIDESDRPIGRFYDMAGGTRLADITGSLKIIRKGKESTHSFNPKWLDSLVENRSIKPIPIYRKGARHYLPVDESGASTDNHIVIRSTGNYQIYANKDDDVSFFLNYQRVGKYKNQLIKIKALSPSGKSLPLGEIDCEQIKEFKFRASEIGLYDIPFNCGVHKMKLISSNRPTSLYSRGGLFQFYQSTGELYFFVPAGTTEFGIKVSGATGEAVGASIFDPTGKLRWSESDIIDAKQFAVKPSASESGKAWKLSLRRPSKDRFEDFMVEIQGLPAFLAENPKSLMQPLKNKGK